VKTYFASLAQIQKSPVSPLPLRSCHIHPGQHRKWYRLELACAPLLLSAAALQAASSWAQRRTPLRLGLFMFSADTLSFPFWNSPIRLTITYPSG